MEHSNNFEKVKLWYIMKMWNEIRVRNAVKMAWITDSEFEEITKEVYAEQSCEILGGEGSWQV